MSGSLTAPELAPKPMSSASQSAPCSFSFGSPAVSFCSILQRSPFPWSWAVSPGQWPVGSGCHNGAAAGREKHVGRSTEAPGFSTAEAEKDPCSAVSQECARSRSEAVAGTGVPRKSEPAQHADMLVSRDIKIQVARRCRC